MPLPARLLLLLGHLGQVVEVPADVVNELAAASRIVAAGAARLVADAVPPDDRDTRLWKIC